MTQIKKKAIRRKARKTHIQYDSLDEEHSANRLLRAGLIVFAREGYHGATTKIIAECAQVNESLIIRHFKSKEGLFLAVIEKNMVKKTDSLLLPLKKNVEEELIAFSNVVMDSAIEKADFSRMVLSHALMNPGFADSMKAHMAHIGKSLLEERLKEVAQREKIPDFDIRAVETIVYKISYMGVLYSVFLGFQDAEKSRQGVHEQIRFFWRSLKKSLMAK
ncbi:MAG: helix-turn-helix domain-containing protein [Bdellovibrio sp.]